MKSGFLWVHCDYSAEKVGLIVGVLGGDVTE